MTEFSPHAFYAMLDVVDERLNDSKSAQILRQGEALLAAKPSCLQLRAKTLSDQEFIALATCLQRLCRDSKVPFCVNDRVDLALMVNADVVHVGQADLPVPAVRKVIDAVGGRMAVGLSTHNMAQALAAPELGADYIGFGPVFVTQSKERPDPVVGVLQLRAVVEAVPLPVVAIGGINFDNLPLVAKTGAAAVAVISAVLRAPDITQAGLRVQKVFASAQL